MNIPTTAATTEGGVMPASGASTSDLSGRQLFPRLHSPNAIFALLLVLGGALIVMLRVPQTVYVNDSVAFLDATRRSAAGEWLGRDFSSPLGPAALFPHALLWRISPDGGSLYALVNGFWFVVLGAIAWWRTGSWPDLVLRAVFALGVTMIGTSPNLAGLGDWTHVTSAMGYNGVSVAIAVLAAVDACSTREVSARAALLAGAYGAFLFWLKFTNVLCLVPLALGLLLNSGGQLIANIARAIIAAALTSGLVFAAARFSLLGYLDDCLSVIATAGADEGGKLTSVFRGDAPVLVGGFGVAGLTWHLWVGGKPAPVRARALIALASCSFLLLGIHFFTATRPLVYLPLLLAVCAYHSRPLPELRALVLALAVVLLAPALIGWGYCVAWNVKHSRPPPQSLLGMPIIRPPDSAAIAARPAFAIGITSTPENNYAASMGYAEALDLARKHMHPESTVAFADYTNPIAAAGLAHGLRGDWILWYWGRTVGGLQLPWLNEKFVEADWILTWRVPPDFASGKTAVIAARLPRTHELATESRWWTLWRKRSISPTTRPPPTPP